MSNGTIGSNGEKQYSTVTVVTVQYYCYFPLVSETVRTFEAPIGNDFPTMGPKEPKTDAVKGLVDTHVAG